MKHTKYLFFLFICLFLNACSDNNEPGGGGGDEDRPETLAWIEDTMRDYYYWYDEIPASKELNYKSGEEDFFRSLLTTKDGRDINGRHQYYSTIEDLSAYTRSSIRENLSYGIEFTGIYISKTEIGALVLYVVPDSPADDAGLERGDWITKVDNAIITNEVYASLQGISKERILKIERWNPVVGDLVTTRENVILDPARKVVDNPVHTYKTIRRGNKSIGYLLYNHFTAGTDDNDKSYDDQLRNLSSSLFNGVDDFVLDLRYNNGGLVSSAMLLCAILAPKSDLNKEYGYLKYNKKKTQLNKPFNITEKLLNPGGKNLNLNRLYVLTSSNSASASEMIINSLRVYMDVIVIGDQTVGKNVGSIAFPDDDKPYPYGTTTWSMHPIVCQISNANNFTDYAKGFKPGTYKKGEGIPTTEGVYIDEAFDHIDDTTVKLVEMLPFGNENERMLKVALDMINNNYRSAQPRSGVNIKTYKKLPFNSLDRKATNGVIIDIP